MFNRVSKEHEQKSDQDLLSLSPKMLAILETSGASPFFPPNVLQSGSVQEYDSET